MITRLQKHFARGRFGRALFSLLFVLLAVTYANADLVAQWNASNWTSGTTWNATVGGKAITFSAAPSGKTDNGITCEDDQSFSTESLSDLGVTYPCTFEWVGYVGSFTSSAPPHVFGIGSVTGTASTAWANDINCYASSTSGVGLQTHIGGYDTRIYAGNCNTAGFYQIVMTISDDGTTTIYVNGVSQGSIDGTTIGSKANTYAKDYICNNQGTGRFSGDIYRISLYDDAMSSSDVADLYANLTCTTPTFSLAEGEYDGAQTVTISGKTGETIYYTTDGSTPSATNGTEYTGAITVSSTQTIKAIAIADGKKNSDVASATYTIVNVAKPVFTPASGALVSGSHISLSAGADSKIYYSTSNNMTLNADGTVTGGTEYVAGSPIALTAGATYYAIAVKQVDGTYEASSVASGTYTITTGDGSTAIGQVGAYSNGSVWQKVGYAGLGNKNELLAFGEYTGEGIAPKVAFDLLFGQSWSSSPQVLSDYVSRVCVWVRPYDDTIYPYNTTTNVCNTFAIPFDYRDPVANNGATLVASMNVDATTSPAVVLNTSEVLESGKQYMIYVTADIKNVSILPTIAGSLPAIGGSANHFTEMGANITAMGGATITVKGSPKTYGSRVLVPKRKVLYTPGDFYSKYYRIPCITRAADGSVVAISDARKYHIHDICNDIDMLARRSTDNGVTWSNPVTIAQGTGGSSTMTDSECNLNTTGYGDAAIVALPNGDLLCTMISGDRLTGQNTSGVNNGITTNFWTVSHDNGQTWSALTQFDGDLYDNSHGCIAPGNMVLVKNGYLAGKVLACFRAYYTSSRSGAYYNYLLTFDPSTNTWSNVYVDDSKYYQNTSSDDEAKLVEVADDTFLMSIRCGNSYNREFSKIVLTSATTATASDLGNGGLSLGQACDGDMITYNSKNSSTEATTRYIFHSLPANQATSTYGSQTTRSSLTIYNTQYDGTGTLSWTAGLNVSDPYNDGTRNETAQYSSMTEENDGNIGLLFEEFPQIVRVVEHTGRGDFLMESVYMQLRPSDLVENEEPVIRESLVAPVITPKTQTYDYNDVKAVPAITVTQANTVAVLTRTTIQVYDASDNLVATLNCEPFEGATHTFSADTLASLTLANGYRVKVSAYCVAGNTTIAATYKESTTTTENYYFKTPVRHLMVWAKPSYGSPTISAAGLGQVAERQILTVGVGVTVTVNAPADEGFTFVGFDCDPSSDTYNSSDTRYAALGATKVNKDGYQIQFTCPTEDAVLNNYTDSVLVIYAYYSAPANGIKTRVFVSRFDSKLDQQDNDDDADNEYQRNWYRYYSNWAPDANVLDDDFPTTVTSAAFGSVSKTLNECTVSSNLPKATDGSGANLYYPTGGDYNNETNNAALAAAGLHLNAYVMPDAYTARNYNAVVMLRRQFPNGSYSYITRGQFNRYVTKPVAAAPRRGVMPMGDDEPWAHKNALTTDTAQYAYYLLQGYNDSYASDSKMYTQAVEVDNWSDETATPVQVKDLVFNNLIDVTKAAANGYNLDNSPSFAIDIFVLANSSEVTDIANLVNNDAGYAYKVTHYLVPVNNSDVTGVENVTTSKVVASMVYYNLMGMQSAEPFEGINIVVTTFTDGSMASNKMMK